MRALSPEYQQRQNQDQAAKLSKPKQRAGMQSPHSSTMVSFYSYIELLHIIHIAGIYKDLPFGLYGTLFWAECCGFLVLLGRESEVTEP